MPTADNPGHSTCKQSQLSADELRAIYISIVENSDDAIIGKKLDGTITAWNRAAERLFGYSATEAIGMSTTMLLPPDRRGEEAYIVERLSRGETIDHYQSKRLTRGGRLVDVALTVSPIRDPNGRIVGASKIIRDISREKHAEAAIGESEARFRQLADSMPQIVWQARADGQGDYCNRRWYEYTGLPETAQIPPLDVGWNKDVIHPLDQQLMAERWNESIRSGEPYLVEIRLKHGPTGTYRWHLVRALAARDAAGNIVRWFGTSTDIDDLKRAEQDRHDSEAKLKALMDAAADGILTLDDKACIASVNPAVERTFRYPAAEMLGQPVQLLMPGTWQTAPHSSEHAQVMEVTGKRKDGSLFPAELSLNGWRLNGQRIFTIIVRDVTDRKRVEERAKEQQSTLAHLDRTRTMSQMAAGLAHELNQPLGAILNYGVALRARMAAAKGAKPAMPARDREILDEIISQTTRAGEIVRRLRSFVKKQQPTTHPRSVNELVQESMGILAFDLRQVGLRPELTLAENLPPVMVDGILIQQVLVNLVRNAIDAMASLDRRRRKLQVCTLEDGDAGICISVIDTGCGVAAEIMENVFDSFFTTKPGGLGMGLALCRTIVEDHSGHLGVSSNPGGGSIFSFWLPPAPAYRRQMVESAETTPESDR